MPEPPLTTPGGKHFSRDLRPLDADGNEVSMWAEDAQIKTGEAESGSGSGSDEESGSEEEREDQGALSREDRKKEKKARKDAAIARKKAMAVEVGDLPPSDDEDSDDDDDMLANPNHSKAARNMARDTVTEVTDDVSKLSVGANRKERETAEAQAAKDRYQALHEQGKTDEAKADLARLRVIREQRAAEAARRQVSHRTDPRFLISFGSKCANLCCDRPRRRTRRPRRPRGRPSATPRWPPSTRRRAARRSRTPAALSEGSRGGNSKLVGDWWAVAGEWASCICLGEKPSLRLHRIGSGQASCPWGCFVSSDVYTSGTASRINTKKRNKVLSGPHGSSPVYKFYKTPVKYMLSYTHMLLS